MLHKKSFETIQEQINRERKLVSFDNYDLSVRELLTMFQNGDIVIPPEYQRQFVWNEERQSKLIESIFLGIPVPNIFMATNNDSTWDVVDGVQRISTLVHFCGSSQLLKNIDRNQNLIVSSIDKLNSLKGYELHQLPKSMQLAFLTRPLRVTVLDDKSDFGVRFDLFERLNTGGVLLTPQEIRNCIFRGKLNDQIKELSNNAEFNDVVNLKVADQNDGTREEFVLRFFAFFDNYTIFEHSVKDFLNDYMKVNQKKKIADHKIKIFNDTFKFIKKSMPSGINRGGRKITPVNLYEAVAVGTALALSKKKSLSTNILKDVVEENRLKKIYHCGNK